MSFWTDLRVPTYHELLVGFYDLTGYTRYIEQTEPRQVLETMAGYFALTGQILGDAGGRLIKTIGDAGLAAFPIEAVDADSDRIPTGVLSVADMANWLKLSRTHLARKLRAAEQLGSLGWQGKRGHSVMWVSKGLWHEFVQAQAAKLAVIEAAFVAGFPRAR